MVYILATTKNVDSKVFCLEAKRRGFIPLHSYHVHNPTSSTYLLSLSPRLFVKLLVQCDLPVVKMAEASAEVMYEVSAASLPILQRTKVVASTWLSHPKNDNASAKKTEASVCSTHVLCGVIYQLTHFLAQHCLVAMYLPASLGLLILLLPPSALLSSFYAIAIFLITLLSTCLWRRREAVAVEESGRTDASLLQEGSELAQVRHFFVLLVSSVVDVPAASFQ